MYLEKEEEGTATELEDSIREGDATVEKEELLPNCSHQHPAPPANRISNLVLHCTQHLHT